MDGIRDLRSALLDREEEAGSGTHGLLWRLCIRSSWLIGHLRPAHSCQAKHLLYLLGGVILGPAKDVRLGTFSIADFVDLSLPGVSGPVLKCGMLQAYHAAEGNQPDQGILW